MGVRPTQSAGVVGRGVGRPNGTTLGPNCVRQGAPNSASLHGVVDGDTIDVVWQPARPIRQRVRLAYVDTPEQGEASYAEATAFLADLLGDRPLRLEFDTPGQPAYG